MDDTSGGEAATYKEIQNYYDENGNLVSRRVPYLHDPLAEFKFVAQCDSMHSGPGEEVFVISTNWLAEWLDFVTNSRAQPYRIRNEVLLEGDGSRTIKRGLMPLFHYRVVSAYTWNGLFIRYGGDFIVSFTVPEGLEEEQYQDSAWLDGFRLHDVAVVNVARPDVGLTAPEIFEEDNPMAEGNLEMIGGMFGRDLGKQEN